MVQSCYKLEVQPVWWINQNSGSTELQARGTTWWLIGKTTDWRSGLSHSRLSKLFWWRIWGQLQIDGQSCFLYFWVGTTVTHRWTILLFTFKCLSWYRRRYHCIIKNWQSKKPCHLLEWKLNISIEKDLFHSALVQDSGQSLSLSFVKC